jgi:hypothetical protein
LDLNIVMMTSSFGNASKKKSYITKTFPSLNTSHGKYDNNKQRIIIVIR